MKFDIPNKLYFKIGEVSRLADVAPHVIRYWETEFDNISPKRASSNQRLYRREDVELILTVKMLLHGKGYTIAGARKHLQSGLPLEEQQAPGNSTTDRARLNQIKTELLQLYELLGPKNQ